MSIVISEGIIAFNHSLGLDFSRHQNVRAQMAVFRDFVELALEWRKPLVLHVRMATVEAMQVMTEVRVRCPVNSSSVTQYSNRTMYRRPAFRAFGRFTSTASMRAGRPARNG